MKRSSTATASTAAVADLPAVEPAPSPSAPASVGALHRVYAQAGVAQDPSAPQATEYVPQRGSYGLRLRGGLPRSLSGRILLGSLFTLILGAVVLTAAAVRQFLLHDPRFFLTSSSLISVQGNEHISRTDVLGTFGSDLERNLFKIPLAERRADLERLPWVAHAKVERLLPNRLRIQIAERTPVAFVRQGSHIGLVDGQGVLLDMPPESAGDPHYSFPVLTGLLPDDTPELRAMRMDVFHRFMSDLDSDGQHRTSALSEVDVTNPEDVKALVTMDNADILVHFGDEQFLPRFRAFVQHLPEWRTQYPKLASADMRYERQVVLEMQDGASPLPSEDGIATGVNPKPQVAETPKPALPAAHRAGEAGSVRHPAAVRLNASERLAREQALRRAAGNRLRAAERR